MTGVQTCALQIFGDVEASERGRERLEVDERLETACGDIRQLQVAPIAERPAASP